MAIPSDCNRGELHRVVLSAESCGRQQKSQNLRISLRSPAGQEVEQQKHHQPAEQTIEQVEGGRAKAHGEEEELSLGTEDRQWAGQRPMNSVESSGFGHVLPPSGLLGFSCREKATTGNSPLRWPFRRQRARRQARALSRLHR